MAARVWRIGPQERLRRRINIIGRIRAINIIGVAAVIAQVAQSLEAGIIINITLPRRVSLEGIRSAIVRARVFSGVEIISTIRRGRVSSEVRIVVYRFRLCANK